MFVGRLRGQNGTQSISHKRSELYLWREQRGSGCSPQATWRPRSLSVIAEVALISSTEDPLTIKYCRTTRAPLFSPCHSCATAKVQTISGLPIAAVGHNVIEFVMINFIHRER